jgi:hypothetical protein
MMGSESICREKERRKEEKWRMGDEIGIEESSRGMWRDGY